MTLKSLGLTGLVFCLVIGVLRADVITLVDGRVLHVKLVAADERGVTVERLDTAGKLKIRWDLLRETDKKRLRVKFGLEEEETEADLVMTGHRVYPRQSDFTDGLVEKEDNEFIYFRHAGEVRQYRKDALRKAPEEREVSVFEVYTPEQLYQKKIEEVGADADMPALLELAKYASKITMYDKAIEHLTKLKELDADYKADYIANQMKRLEILDKDKETRKVMREADNYGYQKRFDDCLARYKEIAARADVAAEIKAEATKKVAFWEKRRWDEMSNQVYLGYFRRTRQVMEEMSRDKGIQSQDPKDKFTIDKAMAFLRSEMHKQTIAWLAEKLKLDPKKEVEKMWKERKARTRDPASYGSGTFVVAGVKDVNDQAGQRQDDIAARMREMLNRRSRSSQKQNQSDQQTADPAPKLATKDEWWERADSIVRLYWMVAYFAENSGQFEITRRSSAPCENCGGSGSVKQLGTQGNMQRFTCPRCQGNKGDTVLYYK